MTDYVTLLGAEDVARASSNIRQAADTLSNAASMMNDAAEKMRRVLGDFDFTISNHQRFMDSWLSQLREDLQDLLPSLEDPLDVRIVKDPDDEPEEQKPVERGSDRPTMPSPGCIEEEETG